MEAGNSGSPLAPWHHLKGCYTFGTLAFHACHVNVTFEMRMWHILLDGTYTDTIIFASVTGSRPHHKTLDLRAETKEKRVDEDPETLVLRMLRSIDEKFSDVQKDVSFLKKRMVILENHAIDHKREVLFAEEALSSQNVRLDSISSKLGRMMRRLNLIDETTAPPDKADTETRRGTLPPD